MKRSEFGKLVSLARTVVEEAAVFGDGDIMVEKKPVRKEGHSATALKPVSSNSNKAVALEEFKKQISKCKKCGLGNSRLNLVFGEGNPEAELMFVGEGPGFDEDHQGRPFVGRSGQLLTKIIEAIGFRREDVFIANIVKCHPMKNPSDPESRGNDRPPTEEESSTCISHLEKQIDIIKPLIICTLGSSSTRTLLKTDETISTIRGKFRLFNDITLMPTYHPAALLRNPNLKKDVWEDMKAVRDELAKKRKR
jgi:uracil-DNA glycosylase family 4